MLPKYLAENFISRVSSHTLCNINIMDDKGIVIASKEASRIGNFHEIAYRMVKYSIPEFPIGAQDLFTGVRPGINLTVMHDGHPIGVIELNGEAEALRDTALLLRSFLEETLKYETLRSRIEMKKSKFSSFFHLLCAPAEDPNHHLEYFAAQLGYQELLRIPILIQTDENELPENFRELLSDSPDYSGQDIIYAPDPFQLMIFKSYRGSFENFSHEYRAYTEAFLSVLTAEMENLGIAYKIYVGSFQNRWQYYSSGYRHCLWMKEQLPTAGKILYFYDFVGTYLDSLLPFWELDGMFNVFSSETDENFRENFISIIATLDKNNYNLTDTSRELYIHKNTLVFRFGKIKDFLNMSPFQNPRDKELCKYLTCYFSQLKQL